MNALIQATDLVKHYRRVHAVNGISFSIQPGTCFGLLGPNGAGKTTAIEMLEGLLVPTGGSIRYRGEPLGAGFREEAGIMFQSTALQEFLTVRETLDMFGRFYRHSVPVGELAHTCALQEFLDRDTHRLSGGQRQRVLLAIALVNDPAVLFLDEPTTGLDPQARRNFWELIQTIKARGKTILLSTHYMEEAYMLCDEIAIMDHGLVIAQGTPGDLLARHFNDVIVELPAGDFEPAKDQFPLTVMQRRDRVEIATPDVNDTVSKLLAQGVSLTHMRVRPRTLEDLFLELTGKELRG